MTPRLATIVLFLLAASLLVPAAAAAAPAISGGDGDTWNGAGPAPTYTISDDPGSRVEWRLDGRGRWTSGRSPLVVTLEPIADGWHALFARVSRSGGGGDDDDDDDDEEQVVRRRFRVDTAAPGVEIREPRPGAVYPQGQVVVARYSCAEAVSCVGPVADGQRVPTDRGGPASFVVRATDDAGNVSAAGVEYAVAAAPAPAPAAGPGAPAQVIRRAPAPPARPVDARLPARRAGLLSPRAGSRLTTLRPLLRWRARAGARLYNFQVFAVEGTAVRKVLSMFPKRTRQVVPRGKLEFGERYLWRVWPYLARGYPSEPIGVSNFETARPVRLGPGQLAVNQRISQEALRRTVAVARWLDDGLTSGDLRDGGLGRAHFSAGVALAGAGAPIDDGLATPRPLASPPRPQAAGRAPVGVTTRQLRINQRISQAAVRHAAAIERRLAAGLTGGDLRDGAVTPSKLAPGLSVDAVVAAALSADSVAAAAPSAPRTRTTLGPAAVGSGGAVRLSDRQVLINLRISQAALRRANRLRELVTGGLTGEHFREGSIGAAKLSAFSAGS